MLRLKTTTEQVSLAFALKISQFLGNTYTVHMQDPRALLYTILAAVSILALGWVIMYHLNARNSTPLRHVPGPWLASCSILYRFYYAVVCGNWHHDLINLHRRYGDIVRIAPNEVSIWDPKVVAEIYAHGDKGYPKCDMYDIALPNGFFNLAVERDIARHAVGRRAIAKDYTMMATLKNEKYFDNVVEELIAGIDKNFASISKVCDWTAWSEYFAYDMITDYVFGKAFGFCKSATDVNGGIRDLRQMLNLSPLLSYMPWIWGLTKNENIKKAGNSHYSKSTRKEITSRLDNGNQSGRYDLLQGLIEARYPDGSPLPLGEITNHSYIFLLAAPDTVSVALRKILMNLIQNPTVHKELLAQLVAADLSKRPTWKELSTIPLLAAIVKESLRLHPPAGFTLPREVPTGGRNLCGYFIPEGTTVGMSAWCVHHNDTFFGPDASEFKPERWLDEKTSMDLEKYTLNFGQGARGCLGKNIAMVQLVKAVAQLVLNFDFEIVDAHKVKSVFVLLVVIDNLKIRFSRRKGGPLDDTVGML